MLLKCHFYYDETEIKKINITLRLLIILVLTPPTSGLMTLLQYGTDLF